MGSQAGRAASRVNAAFLQEIKDDNVRLRKLLKVLHQIAARPTLHARCGKRFLALLTELRDQLSLHFSLEEAYGYMEHAVSREPNCAQDVSELKSQHGHLHTALCELVELCDVQLRRRPAPCPPLPPEVVQQFWSFENALGDHEEREMELIYQTLYVDTGVGD